MNEQAPRSLSPVVAWAIAVYYVVGLVVSYGYWTQEGDPSRTSILLILALHVAVGAIVGRWWIALLPLVWAALPFAAVQDGDIEASDARFVALTVPFVWMPALLVGVAIRRLADPRGRTRRRVVSAGALLLVLGAGYIVFWSSQPSPSDLPDARFATIDEVAGTYGGVGLGDSPADITAVHGPNRPVGEYEAGGPKDAVAAGASLDYPNFMRGIGAYCYADACFIFYDPRSVLVPPNDERLPASTLVDSIEIASPGAKTLRGIQVGDSLEDVQDAYPDLTCGSEDQSEREEIDYCRGKFAVDRWIWFGGDPVNVIILGVITVG